ncbi:MAG: hypothetical protein KBG15_16465 [Kofleriaceae bacterium]|nr:hypothetical protein [Kofleriaceae bacterium]
MMSQGFVPAMLTVALAACGSSPTQATDPTDAPRTGADASATDLAANDVSILFPLPASSAQRRNVLWLVPKAGEQGPGFDPALIESLPNLNADLPSSLGYPSAMVTSLRFDPCFPRLDATPCQAQLRLVVQPVLTGAASVQLLDDAAAHLFYQLTPADSANVVEALRTIKQLSTVSTAGALRVHPGLAAQPDGAAAQAVRNVVVTHCRTDNLIRISTNSFAMDNWGFSKFDMVAGTLQKQPLLHMQKPNTDQAWLRQAQRDSLDDPSGSISPPPSRSFGYLLALANYRNGMPVDSVQAQTAADILLAIENPTLKSTEDVDCVSCHLATQTRRFAARNGVSFNRPSQYLDDSGAVPAVEFAPQLNGNLGSTIAFGWHTNSSGGANPVSLPSISQRTANESAAVVAYLQR